MGGYSSIHNMMKLLLCAALVACVVYSAPVSESVSSMAPMAMNVSVVNNVVREGSVVPLQIREVDQGKKKGTICVIAKLGDTCTGINKDWVASATDGSWDAGDIFSEWWGDPSWNTAVATYNLTQGTPAKPSDSYINYAQIK